MIFTQPVFFAFFALTFGVHWALENARSRKLWLLAMSYVFYGYWDVRFVGLIVLCTVFDYAIGLLLARTDAPGRRHALIAASLCMNLGLLGFFKYYGFFVDSALALLKSLDFRVSIPLLKVVLPAGISFFTFQTMSYTIDVYRRQLEPQRNFLDFALFVGFFPQLVSGPIVRASQFLPQLTMPRVLANVDVRRALALFAVGYFKKACVADNIAAAIDPVFNHPTSYTGAERTLSALLYSVQIYCDFSGYTDMALGAAALLGYELAVNFRAPYFSVSVREFWQRWHISLSTWLRDYLYIPLGGNRGGAVYAARNMMITMLLGGLWHGANWTFILWGFLHGAALAVHRLWLSRPRARASAAPAPSWKTGLSWLATFSWVVLCFTIFRCPNIHSAFEFLIVRTARGRTVGPSLDWWVVIALLAAAHYFCFRHREAIKRQVVSLPDLAFYPALGGAAALLLSLTPAKAAPFIYFQF
jgi:alginate O-acetyltransferase complex protein AlgI